MPSRPPLLARPVLGALAASALALSLAGCVTKAIADQVGPPALSWATEDRLAVSFAPPDAFGSARLVRHGDVASVGTAVAVLRVPGQPERETMVQEAREGPLGQGDEVLACYDLEPPLHLGFEGSWEATALIVARQEGRPAVLVRGPFGWTRASVQDFEQNEPSVGKAVAAGAGLSALVVCGVGADALLAVVLVGLCVPIVILFPAAAGHIFK